MSLYYETAEILSQTGSNRESLKSKVYGNKALKSPPAAIYALASEATKWSAIVTEVIERSGILQLEKKLTPTLALLLVHDLLLAKRGVAAPKEHVLTLAVNRHKARLNAEFTKCRIKRACASVADLRQQVEEASKQSIESDEQNSGATHPRWVRVNTIKANLQTALEDYFSDYTQTEKMSDLFSLRAKHIYIDPHIPNLLALPPDTELTKHNAYLSGALILQDKASCFPAYLIDPNYHDKHIIDACAAPGNKTTHLAGIVHSLQSKNPSFDCRITACERNRQRAETLQKMVKLAGGDETITVRANQDFLALDPKDEAFQDATALLLDPSCSGSGIVGRDANAASLSLVLTLPSAATTTTTSAPATDKKRKRPASESSRPARAEKQPKIATDTTEENPLSARAGPDASISEAEASAALEKRLANLSLFQLKILKHAMAFPAATRITYSTCSVHATENENVVMRALASDVAREMGWRVLTRAEQVDGMRRWERRGDATSTRELVRGMNDMGEGGVGVLDAEEIAEACIRCAKGTDEGTMGFFVCGFVRNGEFAGQRRGKEKESANKKQNKKDKSRQEIDAATSTVGQGKINDGIREHEEEEDWEGFQD